MTTNDDIARHWQDRVSRYRRLSTLIRKHGTAKPLQAVVSEFERLRQEQQLLLARTTEQMSYTQVLLAEIDIVLARARGASEVAGRLRRGSLTFSADDAREESLLCCEEAQSTENLARRCALAARAAALALVAEQIDRSDGDGRRETEKTETSSPEGPRG